MAAWGATLSGNAAADGQPEEGAAVRAGDWYILNREVEVHAGMGAPVQFPLTLSDFLIPDCVKTYFMATENGQAGGAVAGLHGGPTDEGVDVGDRPPLDLSDFPPGLLARLSLFSSAELRGVPVECLTRVPPEQLPHPIRERRLANLARHVPLVGRLVSDTAGGDARAEANRSATRARDHAAAVRRQEEQRLAGFQEETPSMLATTLMVREEGGEGTHPGGAATWEDSSKRPRSEDFTMRDSAPRGDLRGILSSYQRTVRAAQQNEMVKPCGSHITLVYDAKIMAGEPLDAASFKVCHRPSWFGNDVVRA
jgi:hypothetical protein